MLWGGLSDFGSCSVKVRSSKLVHSVQILQRANKRRRHQSGGVVEVYGLSGPLIQAVPYLYDPCQSLVRIAGSKSDSFLVTVGLHLGVTDSVHSFYGQKFLGAAVVLRGSNLASAAPR